MKLIALILFQAVFASFSNAQSSEKVLKNVIGIHQSIYDCGGTRVRFSTKSSALDYIHYFKNLGVGIALNRIQMKKEGLHPIGPTDEVFRRDNLNLYYANILVSYRFKNFCPIEKLVVKLDIAPSFLVGGQNSYYGEIDAITLQHNSYWKNPDRMEYETKFNLFGRIGVYYTLFTNFEVGANAHTYLKFIAPEFMGLPIPWGPNPRQLNKSSFWSLSLTYNF